MSLYNNTLRHCDLCVKSVHARLRVAILTYNCDERIDGNNCSLNTVGNDCVCVCTTRTRIHTGPRVRIYYCFAGNLTGATVLTGNNEFYLWPLTIRLLISSKPRILLYFTTLLKIVEQVFSTDCLFANYYLTVTIIKRN